MSDASRRQFGGRWTDEKLDALRSYLAAYTKVLSNAPFERIYIDAFAGAGTREITPPGERGLFDEELAKEDEQYRHGSPLIALGIDPPFHRLIFIERDAVSISKLRGQVERDFPAKLEDSEFLQGDANEILQSLATRSWKKQRAVAFLDPFALQVRWETIELIGKCQAIDMWLLFPAMAVNRMLPKSGKVPDSWAAKLRETFGSDTWKDYLYKEEQADMFGERTVSKQPKIFEKLSEFITMRLDTAFAGSNKHPLILKNRSGTPLFLFCFASGNPKGAPIAIRIANHIITKKSHGH